MPAFHDFTALVRSNPAEAKEKLIADYKAAHCCLTDVALKHGVQLRTVGAWVKELGIGVELLLLEDQAKKEGWHHGRRGGRPPKTAKRAKRSTVGDRSPTARGSRR